MPTIKIISNPYYKFIRYQKWDSQELRWIEINKENNPNSQLIKNEFSKEFFPFKAEKIVGTIISEYETQDEKIELKFEGTEDEYKELALVCQEEVYMEKVSLSKSKFYLENARDILPSIKDLFKEMSSLIESSLDDDGKAKIKVEKQRFMHASSDIVPICVVGNYSSGKSTFINALIGSEILPSGTEAVTAKIYKISRSEYPDRAKIKFTLENKEYTISFSETDTKISMKDPIIESEIIDELKILFLENKDQSISYRVNTGITFLNLIVKNKKDVKLSDLIEVEVPFVNGVLAKTQHPFVIFDTPGSNSASNIDHKAVLKKAMATLTNGLPIFLSTPQSLDSDDGLKLYQIIHDMKELDSRFTMLVVNQADTIAGKKQVYTKEEKKAVLAQAVPRNFHAERLYYVSSIIGLGSKTNGEFYDEVYEEVYEDKSRKYSDPTDKFYRNLYLRNIMPSQLKKQSDELARKQNDLVYANSGLFTVEKEIEQFAGKHSAYNKCVQSQLFLKKVVQITDKEIESQTKLSEEIRQNLREKTESDKRLLIGKLEKDAGIQREKAISEYDGIMQPFLDTSNRQISVKSLSEKEAEFIKIHEEELDYSSHEKDAVQASKMILEDATNNLQNIWKEKSFNAIKNTVDVFFSDVGHSIESSGAKRDVRKEIEKKASDSLIEYVSNVFDKNLEELDNQLDEKSKSYWTKNTENVRNLLAQIVMGSDELTKDKRIELNQIIITYQKVSFENQVSKEIFKKGYFEKEIRIGNIVIWKSSHLNIDKLSSKYNSVLDSQVNEAFLRISNSHKESAIRWIQSLLDEIITNIVKYSPELSKQADQIRIMTNNIESLYKKRKQLEKYLDQLYNMMNWKTSSLD